MDSPKNAFAGQDFLWSGANWEPGKQLWDDTDTSGLGAITDYLFESENVITSISWSDLHETIQQVTSDLARTKVLIEAGTDMLAQANQSNASILKLIPLPFHAAIGRAGVLPAIEKIPLVGGTPALPSGFHTTRNPS